MFRKLTLILILILALTLVACGGDDEEPAEETAAEETAAEETIAEEEMEEVTLTIESWRNDDLAIWQDATKVTPSSHLPMGSRPRLLRSQVTT